jgi:hypothetical protein
VDLNGDGRRDVLSGSYHETVDEISGGFFQVLYGEPNGKFRKAEVVKGTDGKPLLIPDKDSSENYCTRPFAVDWDGDGKLDLVVGNYAGTFYWFHGEGKGKFQPKPERIMAGNGPLRIESHHSDPFAIDWDGDGDLDLLSGSSDGGVQLSENTAGAGKPPRMSQFKFLIKPAAAREKGSLLGEEDLTEPGSTTRVWVADINRDGKLDLLVGDDVTLISPVGGVTKQAFPKKYADWNKAMEDAIKAVSAETDAKKTKKALEDYEKLQKQSSEFMKQEYTGFVWLYLQK